jgi:hypothetical protein
MILFSEGKEESRNTEEENDFFLENMVHLQSVLNNTWADFKNVSTYLWVSFSWSSSSTLIAS